MDNFRKRKICSVGVSSTKIKQNDSLAKVAGKVLNEIHDLLMPHTALNRSVSSNLHYNEMDQSDKHIDKSELECENNELLEDNEIIEEIVPDWAHEIQLDDGDEMPVFDSIIVEEIQMSVSDTFDINGYAREKYIAQAKAEEKLNSDDEILLSNYCPQSLTKGNFARDLNDFSILFHIPPSGMDNLLAILKKTLPNINWPTSITKRGVVKSVAKDFCKDDNRILEFHVCPKLGCMAFVGRNAEDVQCSKCSAQRFTHCTHKDCETKMYYECTHTLKYRVSLKSLFYRPITTLLLQLLETKGFLHAIKYSFRDKTNNCKYIDASDGSTYQKNSKEMIEIYNDTFGKMTSEKPIMINILLGQWYDGCAIFKNKVSPFWPMNIVILNLPPSYRIKLGVGMFLLTVFTGVSKSNSEDFFLRHLLVGELKALCKGVKFTIGGKDYFVQVRMILTMLDTKAVEGYLKVQGAASLAGCFFCKHGKGYNNGKIPVCYPAPRNTLPLSHFLRKFGQSGCCCPKDFFVHSSKKLKQIVPPEEPEVGEQEVPPKKPTDVQQELILPKKKGRLDVCDKDHSKLIRKFYGTSESPWTWEFPEVDMTIFNEVLYYPHCDYRKYVQYERRTNQSYLINGKEARENRRKYPKKSNAANAVNGVHDNWPMSELKYCDIQDVCWGPMHSLINIASNIIEDWKNSRTPNDTVINYCKATLSHPDLYTYIDQTNNKVEILGDIDDEDCDINVNEPTKQDEQKSTKDKKQKSNKKRKKNSLANPPKWSINSEVQKKIEAQVIGLDVPNGFSSDFQAKFIFQHTDSLHGMGRIQTVTVLMPLICEQLSVDFIRRKTLDDTLVNSKEAYQEFYMMLRSVFCKIMSHKFKNDNEIDALYKRVNTLLCLHEGLYPISESLITWHQILDITMHIKKFGPIKCWWEFSGERSLGAVKKHIKKDGQSYDKNLMRAYSKYENLKLKNSYNFSINDIHNLIGRNKKDPNELKLNDEINSVHSIFVENECQMLYSDEAFYLEKMIAVKNRKKDATFEPFEIECLLDEFILEVKKRCSDKNEACKESGLYRLYVMYERRKESKKIKNASKILKVREQNILRNNRIAAAIASGITDKEELNKIGDVNGTNEEKNNYDTGEENDTLDIEQMMGRSSSFYEYLKLVIKFLDVVNTEIPSQFAKEDIETAKRILVDFYPCRFENALVFGIRMESRGMQYSEKREGEQFDDSKPINELNNLSKYWNTKTSFSSWFKYRYNNKTIQETKFGSIDYLELTTVTQRGSDLVTKFNKDKFCFGQFNYFFRINLPSEPLLNGLPMASAVCRLARIENYMQLVDVNCSPNESYIPNKRFVALTNVYSTKLLVGGRDEHGLPYQIHTKFDYAKHTTTMREFSDGETIDVKYLYLLDLHPHQESVKYDRLNNSYYRFEFGNQKNYC